MRNTPKDEAITPAQYRAFQDAYDFFNKATFQRFLAHVLVTLQRKGKARGYFAPDRFSGRVEETKVHELAIKPRLLYRAHGRRNSFDTSA